jgi:hypothetical protein
MKTKASLASTPCSKPLSTRLRTACATWLLPLLLLTPPAALQAQFAFTTNNGAITITRYYGPLGTNVTIPSSINGWPVTTIAGKDFQNSGLTSVTIPKSVTNIAGGAFAYTATLTAITVATNNPAYSSLNGVLFNRNQTSLVQYPGGKLGAYAIPNNVSSIGSEAFAGCTNLTGVTIGNNVTSIGFRAFDICTSLTSATVPNSVTTMGGGAFTFCTSLTNIVLGNSVTIIGDEAFYGCTSLTSISIPDSVVSIEGWGAFANCTNLTNVIIGNGLTNIGDALHAYPAFPGCSSLTAITVNTDNPAYSSLNGVLFNRSQTTLVEYPAGKVGAYSIPNSVADIIYAAFFECTALTSVTAGNNLSSIKAAAFAGCVSLTNITVGSGLISLETGAFDGCYNLTGVYFQGNAPPPDLYGPFIIGYYINATVYYLPGTAGWGTNYGGRPTAPWFLPHPLILAGSSFGVQTNGFGFVISWATNIPVLVEACTDLANPLWFPVGTNILTHGSSYFSDPQWSNYPARFYRLRSP